MRLLGRPSWPARRDVGVVPTSRAARARQAAAEATVSAATAAAPGTSGTPGAGSGAAHGAAGGEGGVGEAPATEGSALDATATGRATPTGATPTGAVPTEGGSGPQAASGTSPGAVRAGTESAPAREESPEAQEARAAARALSTAVTELRGRISAVTLPLPVEGIEDATRARRELLAQLDDYVLPRLADLDAPLLAVVGGSTGAGKSTLVNSLAGAQVSEAGVLRPTTLVPVLVHHQEDTRWFDTPRVLPDLARVAGGSTPQAELGQGTLRLVQAPSLPSGVALLDAPDIDSVVAANRDLARQLLGAADLWLFVTTAARYADAVPWELLREAASRGASVAIVLDRVPPEAIVAVRDHLAGMLATEGLRAAPLFTLAESKLDGQGRLPERQLAPLRDWLGKLGTDPRARGVLVRRTLSGALAALDARAETVAEAASAQVQTVEQLQAIVQAAFAQARRDMQGDMADGAVLRGEVLARWQDYVGGGDLARALEAAVGRVRDRVTSAVGVQSTPATHLGEALHIGIAQEVRARGEQAVAQSWRRWSDVPGSRDVVAAHPELETLSPEFAGQVERLVRDWQGDVMALVRAEGKDRRSTARLLSFGVNAAGVMLMLAVFFHTGGLTLSEGGIAGGTAVAAQKVLEAIFGDQAVRELAAQARAQLLDRVDELFQAEEKRMLAALDEIELDRALPEQILRAAAAVKAAR